jgi:hypothetical protein
MSDARTRGGEVLCPRCGYDLRGVVSTWSDACPLAGRCGECGLDVEWSELLGPAASRPAWCFEFARRARLARSTLGTFGRIFAPWKFWSDVRMVHPIERRRLAAFAVLSMLLAYAVFVAAHALIVNEHWSWYFVRQPSVTTEDTRLGALLWAALFPWSSEQLATGRNAFGPFSLLSSRDIVENYWRYIGWSGFAVLIMAATGPLVLAGLRASRRLVGIRAAHLVRIGVYSLGWAALVWTILAVDHVINCYADFQRWTVGGIWADLVGYSMLAGFPLWFFAWWWAASRRYLRIRHGAGVAAAVTAIAVLGAIVVLTVVAEPLSTVLFRKLGLVA